MAVIPLNIFYQFVDFFLINVGAIDNGDDFFRLGHGFFQQALDGVKRLLAGSDDFVIAYADKVILLDLQAV